ncbi:MAG: glycosyltransferase family 2 protein [Coriobacteriales bacterium]|nr:glycosyltransferase family 2 protein [Coriobacteriales bacterium]
MCRASVVVPVYNVLPYLDECLASVCAQTLSDVEVVCVDDGSTDGSGQACEAWTSRDARVRVLHKENGGLSSARNAGIDAARGTYLFFLDADDALEPDALERICAAFDETNADVVTFGATCFPEAATPWLERCLSPREVVYEQFSPALLLSESSNPFAWRTACKRDWLVTSGVRFDEGVRYGEDTIWHFCLYPASRRTALVPDKVYRYRLNRAGSLMSSDAKGSARRVADHVTIVEHVFAAWDAAGLLDTWGAELVGWSVAYVLYAALRQPEGPERDESLRRLKELYQRYVFPRQERLRLAPSVHQMVLLALGTCSLPAGAVCLWWRIHEYGIVDLVQTVLGRGGSRSGSGE